MDNIQKIKDAASVLNLKYTKDNISDILYLAQSEKFTYLQLLNHLLDEEINQKKIRNRERRIKMASLPQSYDLNVFDVKRECGITKQELNQLRELKTWVDKAFNVIIMGPSGIGKTHIAAGLIFDAINQGYKAYFKTIRELIDIINYRDQNSTAFNAYKRMLKADMIAIDDIMMFPMKKQEATELFNLLNALHENCSIIITSNKSPKQWAEAMNDEVIAAALLDRLMHKCEVVNLKGMSYRVENRETILDK